MSKFDPMNPSTWGKPPYEDVAVPPHRQSNAERQADWAEGELDRLVERYSPFNDSDYEDGVQREALDQLRREQGDAGIRQVGQGKDALHDALRALDDAESALRMTDEDIADELHRRDPIWWAAIQEARRVYHKYMRGEDDNA